MQKAVGSSPIIRSFERPAHAGFLVPGRHRGATGFHSRPDNDAGELCDRWRAGAMILERMSASTVP